MPFVDIHCHLLFGVDDGCRTREDTLALGRQLVTLGWSTIAVSPHARSDFPSDDALLCQTRLAEVQELFEEAGIALTLSLGAENYLDEDFMARVDRGAPRGVAGGRYSLVELPHRTAVPAMPELVFRMLRRGVTPILAHPERCIEFAKKGQAEEAVRLGAALQLDLGSLTGRYGKDAKKLAERFLGDGLYAIAATDCHSPVNAEAWVTSALELLGKRVGAPQLARLLEENPRRAIAGEELIP